MFPYLQIGAVKLPMYGLCILTGAVIGVLLAMRRARRTHVNPDDVLYCVTYTAIAAILGGKLLWILTSLKYIGQNASYFFGSFAGFREFFSYGFVFYGGLIGGLAVLIPYTYRHKLNVGDMINLLIPVVPLVHAVGRVGCFCAGCCYGIPMDAPWGVYFNSGLAPMGVSLFPVQLLESACNLILFGFLFYYARKPRKPGKVLGLYLSCYAVERFFLEFLRYDAERGAFLGVSTSQWIGMLLLPLGLILIFVKFEKRFRIDDPAGVGSVELEKEEETEDAPAEEEKAEEAPAEENTEEAPEDKEE